MDNQIIFENLYSNPGIIDKLGKLSFPEKEVFIETTELDKRTKLLNDIIYQENTSLYLKSVIVFFTQKYGVYLRIGKSRIDDESSTCQSLVLDADLSEIDLKKKNFFTYNHFRIFNLPKNNFQIFFSKSLKEHRGYELFIRFKNIHLEAVDSNEYYCSIWLYSISTSEKLSENFSFHYKRNSDKQPVIVGNSLGIFNLHKYDKNICFVVSIEKIYTGNTDFAYQTHVKEFNPKDKEYNKYQHEINCAVNNKIKYYQPFFYSSALLPFEKSSSKLTETLKFDLCKAKTDVNTYLDELHKKKEKKSQDSFGYLELIVSNKVGAVNRISTSQTPVKDLLDNLPIAVEVQQFASSLYPYPFTEYVNNVYFYPGKLNLDSSFSSYKNISIEVKILLDDISIENPGMPCIYARSSGALSDVHYTSVWHSNNKPRFNDEIKISLPANINRKAHLVLTFLSLSLNAKRDGNYAVSTPFAYSIVPLNNNDVLCRGNFEAILVPINNYRRYLYDDEFFVRKRGVLDYYLAPYSSFLTSDPNLSKVLNSTTTKNLDEYVKVVDPKQVISLIYPILYYLFLELMKDPSSEIVINLFAVLNKTALKYKIELEESMKIFAYLLYDQEVDSICSKFYSVLIKFWIQQLNNYLKTNSVDNLLFGSFIQHIIIKSLAFDLDSRSLLRSRTVRKKIIDVEFYKDLENYIRIISGIIRYCIRTHEMSNIELSVSNCTAVFISDLYRLVDRDKVNNLVNIFFKELSTNYNSPKLMCKNTEVLTTFFLILVNNDNFYPLNLPLFSEFQLGMEPIESFLEKHYLVGVYTKALKRVLSQPFVQPRVIFMESVLEIFWSLYCRTDMSENEKKNVMFLYWPIVHLLIEKWHTLSQTYRERVLAIFIILCCISNSKIEVEINYYNRESWINLNTIFLVITSAMNEFSLKQEECLFAEFPNFSQKKSKYYFIEHLTSNITLEESQTTSNAHKLTTKKKLLKKTPSPVGPVSGSTQKAVVFRRSIELNESSKGNDASFTQMYFDFSLVVASITINFLVRFVDNFMLVMDRRDMIEAVWRPLFILLSADPVIELKLEVFLTMHYFTKTFGRNLFLVKNNILDELLSYTLEYSENFNTNISNSAKSLFMKLIEVNYQVSENIDYFSSNLMVSCIKSVGSSKKMLEMSIYDFAINSAKKTFPLLRQSLDALHTRIGAIFETDAKLHKYQYNKEVMAELYCSLSKQFFQSPDECITWLENLAQLHKSNTDLQEFAQVSIVMAAYVRSYSNIVSEDLNLVNTTDFNYVSPNLCNSEFCAPACYDPDLMSIQSSEFKIHGYLALILRAIEAFSEGAYYEYCLQSYRLIMPIYCGTSQYSKMSRLLEEQLDICRKLIDDKENQNRLAFNYYRVTLIGKKINEKGFTQHIYKEMPSMRLIEFKESILNKLALEHGNDIEMLGNNLTDYDEYINKDKVYYQICNVEPLNERPFCGYDKHFRLYQFVMDQPFAKSGKAQVNFDEQYIRRTIYTTQGYFPGLLKRLEVMEKTEKIITPIECAIDLVRKRTECLRSELAYSKVNIKNIERELTGTLLTQVNVGLLTVIEKFLSKDSTELSKDEEDSYSIEHREALTQSVLDFEKAVNFSLVFIKRSDMVKPELLTEFMNGISKLHDSISALPFVKSYKRNIDLVSNVKKDESTLGEEIEKRMMVLKKSANHTQQDNNYAIKTANVPAIDVNTTAAPYSENRMSRNLDKSPKSSNRRSNTISSPSKSRNSSQRTSKLNPLSNTFNQQAKAEVEVKPETRTSSSRYKFSISGLPKNDEQTLITIIEELKKRTKDIANYFKKLLVDIQNCQKLVDVMNYIKLWKTLKENLDSFCLAAPQFGEIKGTSDEKNKLLKAQNILVEEISIAIDILSYVSSADGTFDFSIIKTIVTQIKKLESIIGNPQSVLSS